mgnify:CR=1 FL=1
MTVLVDTQFFECLHGRFFIARSTLTSAGVETNQEEVIVMEHEQRVRQGRIDIGRDTLRWVFGEDTDTSDVEEERLESIGREIEHAGLRRVKKGLEAEAN